MPRYVSTEEDGSDEREFLLDFFPDAGRMLDAVFLKGYQWPFDPRKAADYGSSVIDILVYRERMIKGRRVFLDYTRNPVVPAGESLDFGILGEESYNYLKQSHVLFGTPIERLNYMNQPAVELYKQNGIDLEKEYLEIAVCAQHNNGGLAGGIWWESNIRNFFPVGEVKGTHGVYRPGGSALNSGQVGSTRAAQYIAARYSRRPRWIEQLLGTGQEKADSKNKHRRKASKRQAAQAMSGRLEEIGLRTSRGEAHIRSLEGAEDALKEAQEELISFSDKIRLSSVYELPHAFQNLDLLITQLAYFSAIADYIRQGGKSRGSYLVYDPRGQLPAEGLEENFRYSLDTGRLSRQVQEVLYQNGSCSIEWRPVRPIPSVDNWYENVWAAFRRDEIIR